MISALAPMMRHRSLLVAPILVLFACGPRLATQRHDPFAGKTVTELKLDVSRGADRTPFVRLALRHHEGAESAAAEVRVKPHFRSDPLVGCQRFELAADGQPVPSDVIGYRIDGEGDSLVEVLELRLNDEALRRLQRMKVGRWRLCSLERALSETFTVSLRDFGHKALQLAPSRAAR